MRRRGTPGVHTGPDGRHRLAFGEYLDIGTDADFEVLAPSALFDQHCLQPCRLGGTRFQPGQIVADQALNLGADRRGSFMVASGAFLDHALQHRHGEGHASGFHRLQVGRGQQPGSARIARLGRRIRQHRIQRADPLTGGITQRRRRVGDLAQVAQCGKGAGNVERRTVTNGGNRRPADVRPPHAGGEGGVRRILRQGCAYRGLKWAHRLSPLLPGRVARPRASGNACQTLAGASTHRR